MAEEGSPFSPQCPPRLWPSCAADGAIRTALALPLRGASPCSSEPPQARAATRSLARTTHLPDLPASCWHRLPHPHTITSAAPLALTYLKWPVEQVSHWPVTGKSDIKRLRARCQFRASWRAYNPPGHGPPSAHRRGLERHSSTAPPLPHAVGGIMVLSGAKNFGKNHVNPGRSAAPGVPRTSGGKSKSIWAERCRRLSCR